MGHDSEAEPGATRIQCRKQDLWTHCLGGIFGDPKGWLPEDEGLGMMTRLMTVGLIGFNGCLERLKNDINNNLHWHANNMFFILQIVHNYYYLQPPVVYFGMKNLKTSANVSTFRCLDFSTFHHPKYPDSNTWTYASIMHINSMLSIKFIKNMFSKKKHLPYTSSVSEMNAPVCNNPQ